MNPIRSSLEAERALEEYHNLYCQLTGRDDRFGHNHRRWWEWSQHFNKAELEQVLRHVLKQNAQRERRFRINIALAEILEPSRFDQLRADSECERKAIAARKRKSEPSQGEKELAAMRHETTPEHTSAERKVSMDMIIDGMRKASQ